MKRSLLVLATAFALFGCSAPDVGDGRVRVNSQPIAGGKADTEHEFVLGMFSQQGQGGGMCTGTLIAPNLVLTARHCVAPSLNSKDYVVCGQSGFGTPYQGNNVYVNPDNQLSQKSKNWAQGAEVRVPTEGNDTCGYDVALVILAKPMDITPAVPRIDKEVVIGESYAAVGYGSTGLPWGGGSRQILDGLAVQCLPGYCPAYSQVQATEWGGETGVCQGDSGGPALDKDDKVIGVVSRGIQGCDRPTYGAVYAWREWIMNTALDAAKEGGYEPPFWAVTGKSDPDPALTPEPKPKQPTAPEDAQGRACSATQGCPSGYACYTAGDPEDAFCAAQCSQDQGCGVGESCNSHGVCTAPPLPIAAADDSESSGGCSLAGGPVRPVPWVIGLALVGLAFGGRRRRC